MSEKEKALISCVKITRKTIRAYLNLNASDRRKIRRKIPTLRAQIAVLPEPHRSALGAKLDSALKSPPALYH